MFRLALAVSFAALALGLSACANESPSRRAYTDDSVWNDTIATKGGTLAASNPNASEFGTMFFGGGPGGSSSHDHDYAKPIYQAADNDPCRSVTLRHTDWNNSNTKIPADACVPVPTGTAAAAGTDGHLTIVSADLHMAWDFWRCKMGSDSGPPCTESNVLANGYEAANGSQWHIHPDDPAATGVASCCGAATGRGSGTELLTSVLRIDEAKVGLRHVMGLSLPGGASNLYVNPPAVKSDGSSGNPIKYGSLWALRPDYPCPSARGPAYVCQDLKDYGAFIVDQGSVSGAEIDTMGDYGIASPSDWQSVGLTRNSLPIQGSDWRCVSLPTVTGECPS